MNVIAIQKRIEYYNLKVEGERFVNKNSERMESISIDKRKYWVTKISGDRTSRFFGKHKFEYSPKCVSLGSELVKPSETLIIINDYSYVTFIIPGVDQWGIPAIFSIQKRAQQ